MRVMFLISVLLLGATSAWAFWIEPSPRELVREADIIVLAKYTGFGSLERDELSEHQRGHLVVERVFKGAPTRELDVDDWVTAMCVPMVDFRSLRPGVCLAFLKKQDDGLIVSLSGWIRQIENDKVCWWSDKARDYRSTDVRTVEQFIARELYTRPQVRHQR